MALEAPNTGMKIRLATALTGSEMIAEIAEADPGVQMVALGRCACIRPRSARHARETASGRPLKPAHSQSAPRPVSVCPFSHRFAFLSGLPSRVQNWRTYSCWPSEDRLTDRHIQGLQVCSKIENSPATHIFKWLYIRSPDCI
jgi:hypothetical protein